MQGSLLHPGEMALNSAASFPHEHLTHPWSPRSLSDLGSICCAGGTPVHIGAIARYIVPLCASQSPQSGLGLPPSRNDVPKSDRLLGTEVGDPPPGISA